MKWPSSGILRVDHDLGQKHVLEADDSFRVVNGIVALEGFIEVREGRLEISLVGRVKNAGLHVQGGLKLGWTVDAVGGCSGRGQSSSVFEKRTVNEPLELTNIHR